MTRLEEIENRKAEIREEVEATDDIEKVAELDKEVETLNEEVKQIEEEKKFKEEAKEIETKGFQVKEIVKEENKMNDEKLKEVRNSKEYVEAYAEYLKGELVPGYNVAQEKRTLLTTNAPEDGQIVVPDIVEETIRTAWERENLMALVREIEAPGNFKIQFEVSADDAIVHEEGSGEVDEENVVLGIVTLVPKSIKKWLSISDEAIDMRGSEFINWVYDELTSKIAKKLANILVAKIAALPQTLTANSDGIYDTVSANKITAAPGVGTIAAAIANLSDEATNPTIVMNKATWGAFKEAQYNANYSVDPFEGLRVVFNNTLPAYGTASDGAVYAIVGDFGTGAIVNFPKGRDVELKYDDKTLMTQDLVRILGRRYAATEPVADKAFVQIAKPTQI